MLRVATFSPLCYTHSNSLGARSREPEPELYSEMISFRKAHTCSSWMATRCTLRTPRPLPGSSAIVTMSCRLAPLWSLRRSFRAITWRRQTFYRPAFRHDSFAEPAVTNAPNGVRGVGPASLSPGKGSHNNGALVTRLSHYQLPPCKFASKSQTNSFLWDAAPQGQGTHLQEAGCGGRALAADELERRARHTHLGVRLGQRNGSKTSPRGGAYEPRAPAYIG